MERPGFLNGFEGFTPRQTQLSAPRRSRLNGSRTLGAFGKGFVAPPPPPEPSPAAFRSGQWVCDDPKPPSDANNYFHCCPSGWTKVPFGDTRPCKGKDREIEVCGPLPQGASPEEATCCEQIKEWVPSDPSGGDPCAAAAASTGQAVPGIPETILAPDIVVPQDTGGGGGIFVVLGIGFVLLTGITIFVKMRN